MSRITLVEVSVALSAPQRAKERSHLASPEWVCTITNRKPMTKVSTAITARLTETAKPVAVAGSM